MTRPSRPPRLATWLLGLVVPPAERACVIGDLFEEYALRADTGTARAAAWWYWGQVCRSLAPLVASAARRGRWLTTVGVAAAGYVAAGVMAAAAEGMLWRLIGAAVVAPATLRAATGLAALLAVGHLAARLRPRAEDVMASIVFLAVAGMLTMAGSAPVWPALLFLVAGPAAAHVGGRLSGRRVSAPRRAGRP